MKCVPVVRYTIPVAEGRFSSRPAAGTRSTKVTNEQDKEEEKRRGWERAGEKEELNSNPVESNRIGLSVRKTKTK
ncbi:unnamed protein product [Onchocerca flexuosa]|uniref:Uncharacterized protein n=1 Tax=Onchocerca flexuosa TaxID=387005 RepID=A0A183I7D1_9BILA|nr:unnamed protein product [Onchocerca flexuosa]